MKGITAFANGLMAFSLLITAQAPAYSDDTNSSADDTPDFYEVVQNHFDRWDGDHDGTLSPKEILKAFESKRWKGNAAAAISVLQKMETNFVFHKQPMENYSLDKIMSMKTENEKKDPNQKSFLGILKTINNESTELFTHGGPTLSSIKQNATNDCYLLSVIGALIQSRPDEIVNLFEATEKGDYLVHFFGTDPIKVGKPSAGEMAVYNTNSDDGMWLPILVKAVGKWREKQPHEDKDANSQIDPIERVTMHGWHTAPIIKLLTGHDSISCKPSDSETKKKMLKAFQKHHVVLVGIPGHAMTGLSYDKQSDSVTMWNPWGSTGNFKEVGTTMDHGTFTLAYDDFTKKITNVVVENPSGQKEEHPVASEVGKAINAMSNVVNKIRY